MRITYDSVADAAYIYLVEKRNHMESILVESVDFWLVVDLDPDHRLEGIEVLDASERLDLKHLRPHIDKLDGPVFRWFHLARKTEDLLKKESPISATDKHGKAWVEEVGRNAIKVRFDATGEIRKVSREELEDLDITPDKVIKRLGILHTLYEMGRPPWPAKPYTIKVERDISELTPKQ